MRGRAIAAAFGLLALAALAAPQSAPTPRAGGRPSPTATPPSSVPSADESSPFVRTPTPTPVVDARLVAALDVRQGEGGERTALFTDGTLVRVVRLGERRITSRRVLMSEEMDVVTRVLKEALGARDEADVPLPLTSVQERRRIRLEVADGETVRTFTFEDLSVLPLPVGRARAAMEDLRARFLVKATEKPEMWDPGDVKEGDFLRRRGDARWFRVARDDTFRDHLELHEVSEIGLVQLLKREDLPKVFDDPAGIDPSELPNPR
jgi:hypothetical protein